ncbi:MAG: toprim domain-containing protein [Pseudomonadota bacterium]
MTDLAPIRAALAHNAEAIVSAFRGEPNRKLSTRHEMRWGRKGSLSVRMTGDRAGVWHDHETNDGGGVLDFIIEETGGDFARGLEWAQAFLGTPTAERPAPRSTERRTEPQEDRDRERRIESAAAIWRQSGAIEGTLAERYLAQRGLITPRRVLEGDALRFHPDLAYEGRQTPGMVALMSDPKTGEPCGVHRTFLDEIGRPLVDESGDKIKRMLGTAGVVRLTPDEDVELGLGITEGIETGLAVLGLGWTPVWAALSAGAIRSFPRLSGIECLTIFADADEAGWKAGTEAGQRLASAGQEVRLRAPMEDGKDWADVTPALQMEGAA